jgi:hypothetical protein
MADDKHIQEYWDYMKKLRAQFSASAAPKTYALISNMMEKYNKIVRTRTSNLPTTKQNLIEYSKKASKLCYKEGCPMCGNSLLTMNGQYGKFFTCSREGCGGKRKLNSKPVVNAVLIKWLDKRELDPPIAEIDLMRFGFLDE